MEKIPDIVWQEFEEIIQEVSDEIGEEKLAGGEYLLKYEGWGRMCVEKVWLRVLANQEEKGIETESEDDIAEREDACYNYAEEQTFLVIDEEWIPQFESRGFVYIDGGFDHGGLYGRAWALFRRCKDIENQLER